jgi:hypothetical protein
MMRRLRLLLMVWVAVALPVQGMASVTMMHCGPGHHGKPGPARASHAGHPADHHASAHESVSGDHHLAAPSTASMSAPSDDQTGSLASAADAEPTKVAKTSAPGKLSCSACASCCLGAAMTAPQSTLPSLPSAGDALVVTEEAAPAGVTVGGLERPPRLNFA